MLGIEPKRFYFKHLSGPYLEDVRYLNLIRKKQDYIVSAGFSGRNYLFLSEVSKKLPDISFIVLTYPWATKNLSFGSNVEIISNISELEYCQYIANGKLFFLPISNKLTANGHIAIVQTMSLGTPLLTNITEGTKDYLCPDVNCVVYEDGAIDSTVATIRQLWSDNNRLIRLAQNGAEFAKEHFSINNDICVIDDLLVKLKGYF
jgi:glycosyltransferase involved in cell wall biosynthesis